MLRRVLLWYDYLGRCGCRTARRYFGFHEAGRFRRTSGLVPTQIAPSSSSPRSGGSSTGEGSTSRRRRTSVFADYFGIFAVDAGTVVGQTFVLRIPYTFPHGTESISGIAGVATRLDHARTGVARRILEEVHRREREAGIGYSTLWTNRSWGAHRLYEKLRVRDVYAPPGAVGVPPARSPRPGRTVRPGHRSDLEAIEELHSRYTEGRWGFTQRPPNFARSPLRREISDLEKRFSWPTPTVVFPDMR